MSKLKQVVVSFFALVFSMSVFAAGEKGNGQLIVKAPDGSVIPFEEFVSNKSRLFMGYEFLPRSNNLGSPFDRDYVTELDNWLKFISSYSQSFARDLKQTAIATDFVFLDSDIQFKIEDYPISDGYNVDYFKAAGYYRGEIYVSIPKMDEYTQSDRFSAEELRAFTIIHELLHPYNSRIDTDKKLALGTLLLNTRHSAKNKVLFHIEAARLGYHFWLNEDVDFRIKFLKRIRSMGRFSKYIKGNVSSDATNITKLQNIKSLLELSKSDKALKDLFPSYLDIKTTLRKIHSSRMAMNPYEINNIIGLFSKTTKEDFDYWLKNNILSSGKRYNDGSLENIPSSLHYLRESPLFFITGTGFGVFTPSFHRYGEPTRGEVIPYIESFVDEYKSRFNEYSDAEEMILAAYITPYLIPYAQDVLRSWKPENICDIKSIDSLYGLNPLFLNYARNFNGNYEYQVDIKKVILESRFVFWYDKARQSEIQLENRELVDMLRKFKDIKNCVEAAPSPEKIDYEINRFVKFEKPNQFEFLKFHFKLREGYSDSKYAEGTPFVEGIEYITQKLTSYCSKRKFASNCRKLEKRYGLLE